MARLFSGARVSQNPLLKPGSENGYTRMSFRRDGDEYRLCPGLTQDQHPALQLDALYAAGCVQGFVEQASGTQRERPQLQAALDYARPGDTLVVWTLDRLARSLTQLIETIEGLAARDIGFRSLTEAIETTTAGGPVGVPISRAWPSLNGRSFANAPEPGWTPPRPGPHGAAAHRP